jgi:DNA-binding response OmpR family regulator
MNRILLVDDDGAVRASLRRLVRYAGYDVQEARNGNEAITLLSQTPVDLAIIDILMPSRDGLETIKEIRTRWPAVRIIAISGGGFCHAGLYLDLSLKLGAARALEKPIGFKELLEVMRAVLGEAEIPHVPLEGNSKDF